MHFDIREEVQDVGNAELVEDDDEEHGQQGSRQGLCLQALHLRRTRIISDLLELFINSISLGI